MSRTALGEDLCYILPFLHAIDGCDTTFRLYCIGKVTPIGKVLKSDHLRKLGHMFMNPSSTKNKIIKSDEQALVHIYGGKSTESLEYLRCERFREKVATRISQVDVKALPPTNDAAK